MEYKVVVTADAEEDLNQYIRLQNEGVAQSSNLMILRHPLCAFGINTCYVFLVILLLPLQLLFYFRISP